MENALAQVSLLGKVKIFKPLTKLTGDKNRKKSLMASCPLVTILIYRGGWITVTVPLTAETKCNLSDRSRWRRS